MTQPAGYPHVYDECAGAIWEHDGLLNKTIGDAIMAVFNFPIRQHDHARQAVLAARAIQDRWRVRRSAVIETFRLDAVDPSIGIGLHQRSLWGIRPLADLEQEFPVLPKIPLRMRSQQACAWLRAVHRSWSGSEPKAMSVSSSDLLPPNRTPTTASVSPMVTMITINTPRSETIGSGSMMGGGTT
jgi:hypothetical protein